LEANKEDEQSVRVSSINWAEWVYPAFEHHTLENSLG